MKTNYTNFMRLKLINCKKKNNMLYKKIIRFLERWEKLLKMIPSEIRKFIILVL